MKRIIYIILNFLIAMSFINALADEGNSEFNLNYKNAKYAEAIKSLEKVESVNGSVHYLAGLCYSRMQEYDQANISFEKAIKENNKSSDLFYEYGQSLFAANELKKSRDAFRESIKNNFNKIASLYYVAYITQLFEEFAEAKKNYIALLEDKEIDLKTKQVAGFQLAETLLAGFKSNEFKSNNSISKNVEEFVLPLLKEAKNTVEKSELSFEISNRISELEKEYKLDPNLLENGKKLSSNRFSGNVIQKIKFDNNITLVSEENNVQQSKKESFVFSTDAYGKYEFLLNKKIIIAPDFRVNFTQHSKQSDLQVYQNDAYTYYAGLKNKYEHLFNNQPASFILNFIYGNTHKSWLQSHSRDAYSSELSIEIGESFSYFNSASSTIKLKYKKYNGVNKSINNNTISVNADHVITLARQRLIILSLDASLVNNYNNDRSSTNSYLGRIDYLIPEIFPSYTLGMAFSLNLTDTLLQKDSRGIEKTLSPSVDLSKNITKDLKALVNFEYTKNLSKSSSYNYTKNIISIGIQYGF